MGIRTSQTTQDRPETRTEGGHAKSWTATRVLSHADLDQKLDRLAISVATFADAAREFAAELDRSNTALEISDPATWRKARTVGADDERVPLKQQFRAEVESFVTLNREAEARLVRRVEFARVRLDKALDEMGVEREHVRERMGRVTFGSHGVNTAESTLPPRVCRRWSELHALRIEVVERNLYLVLLNVKRRFRCVADQADPIQEGAAALFRAVDRFDWRRGLLFRTYAVHWLNQAFRSYIYDFGRTVRVPAYLQKALRHIDAAKQELGDLGAAPSQIAQVADLDEHLVDAALKSARWSYSIDVTFDDDRGRAFKELVPLESDSDPYTPALETASLQVSLAKVLARLTERERFVIERRFGLGHPRAQTLAEVGEALRVSLEGVRQIQVRAIRKMRTSKLRRQVEPFLQ